MPRESNSYDCDMFLFLRQRNGFKHLEFIPDALKQICLSAWIEARPARCATPSITRSMPTSRRSLEVRQQEKLSKFRLATFDWDSEAAFVSKASF
jgi:hypothetical protein